MSSQFSNFLVFPVSTLHSGFSLCCVAFQEWGVRVDGRLLEPSQTFCFLHCKNERCAGHLGHPVQSERPHFERQGSDLTCEDEFKSSCWSTESGVCCHLQVCDGGLYSIRVEENGRLVACGSEKGEATLLEISSGLSVPQKNEKSLVAAVRNPSDRFFNVYLWRSNFLKKCFLSISKFIFECIMLIY